ncbi:hypothetical protein [Gracilibacillus sp. YIM 98692]|uniref:hypothetical protein n=1 Tax=Gracilibacillus sp. YIM 98692 TaxID=2663532 RepID=UPI0013D22A58|nr:hypothetical protein [Gracilibacillus sp. YIM 98692]
MLKKIIEEFMENSALKKFDTVSNLFTISGVSLFAIFSALNGVNLMQVAMSFLVIMIIFLGITVLVFVCLFSIDKLRGKIPPIVINLLIIVMIFAFLFFIFFSVANGISFVKTFKDY